MLGAALRIFLLATVLCISACQKKPEYFLGYVEGRLTYIASPFSGKLTRLSVVRGQWVKAGDALFQLEGQPQSSELNSALASVRQISADLSDKIKGDRPSELAAISAQIAQAQAQLDFAKKDVARKQQLVAKRAIEQNQLDTATQNLKVAQAQVQQYQANLTTGNLGGREGQIQSLKAQLDGAKANLEKAQWNLSQKTVNVPVNAQIFDTYSRVGEQVPANQAVLSILAPRDIKIVFFVHEATLSQIKVGQIVHVNCDSCQAGISAKISFISPSAEYTPPVIYSRSARSKLVYEVEAQFDRQKVRRNGAKLNPGQPVEVSV
jgi:HlyD family secretion protein